MKSRLTVFILFFSINQTIFAQDAELCSPYALSVFGGNQENVLSWVEASNIGCGNYSVNEMPFYHIGSNAGMGDNWDVSASDGDDVAYTLTVSQTTTYDFTLCSQDTDYDTKLEIFTLNGDECGTSYTTATSTGNYNDDFSCEFSNLQSSLLGVTLQPGQYYVVVDGYNGATGNYGFSISAAQNRINNFTSNSVKDAWPEEELKMFDSGFSQEMIDTYESEVMNPGRYALRNNSNRDVPEECGTFTCYRVYDAETNDVLLVQRNHLSPMVTLQTEQNTVTISLHSMKRASLRSLKQFVRHQTSLNLHLQPMYMLRSGMRKSHSIGQSQVLIPLGCRIMSHLMKGVY